MRFRDSANGYGWVSIALHWLGAVAVVALWFAGDSIGVSTERQGAVAQHVSIAVCAYVVLWARVIWRFRAGYPAPLRRRPSALFSLSKMVHFILIIAIAVMLLSGPVMALSGGIDVAVFGQTLIPADATANAPVFILVHALHQSAATVIVLGTLLHIAGVIKHMAWDRDGTFSRIMVPAPSDAAQDRLPADR